MTCNSKSNNYNPLLFSISVESQIFFGFVLLCCVIGNKTGTTSSMNQKKNWNQLWLAWRVMLKSILLDVRGIISVPDNCQRGVLRVNRCGSPHTFSSLPFIFSGQVDSFPRFLTQEPLLSGTLGIMYQPLTISPRWWRGGGGGEYASTIKGGVCLTEHEVQAPF